jgi:hypothetical protein
MSEMSTARRVCWNCHESIFRTERHCPNCSADQWNVPQGKAGIVVSPASTSENQTASGQGYTSSILTNSIPAQPYNTHPNVVAGISILTILSLLSVTFTVALALINAINDPGFGDTLSGGRVLLAGILAIVATTAIWVATINYYDDVR